MLAPYDPYDSRNFYQDYYNNQIGHGLSVYTGKTVMDGSGIGSMFSGLLSRALPVLKSAGKTVGKRLLASTANIARDALAGENIAESAKKRFRLAGEDLLGTAASSLMRNNSKRKVVKRKVKKPRKRNQKGNGGDIFSDIVYNNKKGIL